MAEFLIYNRPTDWMDAPSKTSPGMTVYDRNQVMIDTDFTLTTEQKIKNKELLSWKHTARYQGGDIVEARKDNGPRGKLEEESFAFLQVPDVGLKTARGYCVAKTDVVSKYPIPRRRKYYMDMAGLVLDTHKNVSLSGPEFLSRMRTK